MKKLIIYVDDDEADLFAEMLSHIDFVRSVEYGHQQPSDVFPDINQNTQDREPADGSAQNEEKKTVGNKNIQQLRSALAAIDHVRDRNKKDPNA